MPVVLAFDVVVRVLAIVEEAWIRIERARIRARRCGAGEEELAAIRAAEACQAELRAKAGDLRGLVDELCRAKADNRAARITHVQATALEAFAECVTRAVGEAEAADRTDPWLKSLVGVGIPAAASILVSAA